MTAFLIADTFAGESGQNVVDRPPTTEDLGGVLWTASNSATWKCVAGPASLVSSNSNIANLDITGLPYDHEGHFDSFLVSIRLDLNGLTFSGAPYGGLSCYLYAEGEPDATPVAFSCVIYMSSGGDAKAWMSDGAGVTDILVDLDASGLLYDIQLSLSGGTAEISVNGVVVSTADAGTGMALGAQPPSLSLGRIGCKWSDFSFSGNHIADEPPPAPTVTILFEDDFDGEAGSIDGRVTDGLTWDGGLELDGAGALTGTSAAVVTLPAARFAGLTNVYVDVLYTQPGYTGMTLTLTTVGNADYGNDSLPNGSGRIDFQGQYGGNLFACAGNAAEDDGTGHVPASEETLLTFRLIAGTSGVLFYVGEIVYPESDNITTVFNSDAGVNGPITVDMDLQLRMVYGGSINRVRVWTPDEVTPVDPSSHKLIKNMTTVTEYGHEEVPAIPYRPATPGYYTTETGVVCGWVWNKPGRYVTVTDPITGQTSTIFLPYDTTPDSSGAVAQATWVCSNKTYQVYHPGQPAQPYVPGYTVNTQRTVSSFNLGWNAGAYSIKNFRGSGHITFQAGRNNVGAVVGINIEDVSDSGFSGRTTDYAFYLSRGVVQIMENGTIKASGGTYTEDTVFGISLAVTLGEDDDPDSVTVEYTKDDTTVYTTTVEVAGAAARGARLEAALYSGNDYVFAPTIEDDPDTGVSDDTTSELAAVLPPLRMSMGSGVFSALYAVLAPLTMRMESDVIVPSYSLLDVVLSPMSVTMHGLTGEVSQLTADLAPLRMRMADYDYDELNIVLAPLSMLLLSVEGNTNASMNSTGSVVAPIVGTQLMVVTMFSTGQIEAVFVNTSRQLVEMFSTGQITDEFLFTSAMQAIMMSVATTAGRLGIVGDAVETWVMNVGTTGSTSYTDFEYNSLAQIGERFYGARSGGIYELAGDTDDDAPIRANISLGQLDFDTPTKSTVKNCYIGMSAAGDLFVKVIAEGREFIYKTRSFNAQMQQQRVTMGKGLRTNYVTLEIYNEDGADFEIDTVQFEVADMSRKI